MKIKFDWWLISGIFFILIGLLQLLKTLGGGTLDFWSIYGPAYILIGIAFFKKMPPAFWVALILSGISFLQPILLSLQGQESTGFSLFDVATLIVLAILWFKMKKKKG